MTALEEDDLDLLLQCVQGAAYEWRKIALGLKLKRNDIKIIEGKLTLIAEGPEGYFREVLAKWLEKTSPLPTIEDLAVAIHNTGKERMAQDLKRKFLQKSMTSLSYSYSSVHECDQNFSVVIFSLFLQKL